MLQFIIDFLFPTVVHGYEVNIAILPLVAAGVGVAGSLLGGYLNNRAIDKGYKGIDNRIKEYEDPNVYLPQLQRIASNSTQGNYNINAQMARQGVDSQVMSNELMEAGRQDRYSNIMQGMDSLEGRRQSMLSNLYNLRQNRTQMKTDNISSTVSGVTNSVTQGIGQKISQQNFDQVMSQQPTYTGQPMQSMNAGRTMGYGQDAYSSSLFGNGSFGSNLYG